jgi:hypothetical protein
MDVKTARVESLDLFVIIVVVILFVALSIGLMKNNDIKYQLNLIE